MPTLASALRTQCSIRQVRHMAGQVNHRTNVGGDKSWVTRYSSVACVDPGREARGRTFMQGRRVCQSRSRSRTGRAAPKEGETSMKRVFHAAALGAAAVLGTAQLSVVHAQWEPNRTVEIIVPAGPGGGADQMSRVIQGIVTKHGLMKQSMVVINKAGGAGGEGFLDVKASRGNPHKLVITLSNLFTTPLATGIPFNWKDLTP